MKTAKQYIKNPNFGQGDEPEFIPVGNTGIDAVKNRLLQVERQELNLTIKNSKNYSTLTEAIADVTDDKYKFRGFVLTFSNGSEWKSMRYNGADSTDWGEVGNWVDAGGAGGTETYFIPSEVMGMPEGTPEEDVLAAFGGVDGLNKFKEAVKNKNIGVEYDVTMEGAPAPFHYRIPVADVLTAKVSNKGQEITYYYLMFSEFDILTETNKVAGLTLMTMGDMVTTGGKSYFGYGTNIPALNLTETGYKIFRVDSRKIFVLELDEAMRNNYYRKIFTQSYEPSNPGEGDIWIQTT